MYRDIRERTFLFSVQIVKLAERMPETRSGKLLANQLVRSGTSVGANVEEASAAFSRNDYAYRMSIALREARET
jgi:four helix bundle protein